MFTPQFDEQWLLQKFTDVDDSFINAGGMRTEKLENEESESSHTVQYYQRKTFAKLVESSRCKRNMSQVELAEKIGVSIEEIVEIEDESADDSIEPSIFYALTQELGITFDYTEWQKEYFKDIKLHEFSEAAAQYDREHPFILKK